MWTFLGGSVMAAEPVEVIVEGIEGEILKNVQAELTLPPGLVQGDKVDPYWLSLFQQRAPERVRRVLEPFGYYNSKIETILEKTEEGFFRIHVNVELGEPVRIASVRVEIHGIGTKELTLQELVNKFPIKEGDVLHQDKYEEAKEALKAKAMDLGYLDADFLVHQILVSKTKFEARIELVLQTGFQYRFGDVTFYEASIYPERFLKRYLTFQPGEVFSYTKIAQTQLNLINSDRFKEVNIDAKKEDSKDFFIPVRINLTPSKPKRVRLGIGYETDLGPRLFTNYQDLNFNRWGHELNAELNISQRLQGLVTQYVLPSRKDLDSRTSFKLGIQREDTKTYENLSVFIEPEYIHSFGRGMLGSVYIQGRLEDFTIGEEDGRSRLLMPGLRFSRRKYNDLIRPTKGYRFALETRGAAKVLGSNTNFLQFLVNGDALIPLPFRFLLLTRVEGGTTLADSLGDLPPSVRFFAGGDRSVRGYAYQSLGPKDANGDVTGGKHLLVGSIELEKAISKIFGVAAFYDVGNAFNSFGHMDLQQGVGLGIRIYTPVGPIRFDLARQVGVKDPDFRVHFTVGFGL
jgi:translocation and assembly module TamA